jgi:hypothetical protein
MHLALYHHIDRVAEIVDEDVRGNMSELPFNRSENPSLFLNVITKQKTG